MSVIEDTWEPTDLRNYSCPECKHELIPGPWSLDCVPIECSNCDYQTTELNLPKGGLLNFLDGDEVHQLGAWDPV